MSRAPLRNAPGYNVKAIEERLAIAQHASARELSGKIAILKMYLRGKSIPDEVIEELDALCHDNEQRWQAAILRIAKLLEP